MSLAINGGAAVTHTRAVTLTLTAPPAANQMRFSEDNATWSDWTPFAATKTYTLSGGNGTKTVYVQFSASSLPGAPLGNDSASITLSMGTIVINGGAADTPAPDVTLTLTAPSAAFTQMRLQNDSGAWGAWQAFAASLPWTLSTGYGSKTVNVEYKDSSLNVASGANAQITYVIANATGTWLILKTPDYSDAEGNQTSYLRLGAPDLVEENALLDSHDGVQNKDELRDGSTPPKTFPGWFEYTDGDRTLVVRGSNYESIQDNETTTIGGKKIDNISGKYRMNIGSGTLEVSNADPIYHIEFFETSVYAGGKKGWRKRELGHNSSDSYSFGDVESFFGGYKFDATFGMTNGIFIGGKVDVSAAVALSLSVGFALELGLGLKYSNVLGKDLKVAGEHEVKARTSIHLRIKPDHEGIGMTRNKIAAALVGSAAAVTTLGLAAGGATNGSVNSDGFSVEPAVCLGLASGVFAAGLAASVFLALRDRAAPPVAPAEIKIEATKIAISQNNALGVGEAMINIGKPAMGAPSMIELLDDQNSAVVLHGDGNLEISAGTNLFLGNHARSASLRMLNNGRLRIKGTDLGANAQRITLGAGNELTVG